MSKKPDPVVEEDDEEDEVVETGDNDQGKGKDQNPTLKGHDLLVHCRSR